MLTKNKVYNINIILQTISIFPLVFTFQYWDYIEECKYINPLIGKKENFNCCKFPGIYCDYEEITTSNDNNENKKNIHITNVRLMHNKLKTSIPDSIGKLNKVTYFFLNNNEISGNIPNSIGDMNSLSWLDLSGNNLEGTIPHSIGNIKTLTHLDLSNNKLKGAVPDSIGNLENLSSLYLDDNQLLNGPLPDSLSELNTSYGYDFKGTKLCYTDSTSKFKEYIDYKCSNCTENASINLINDICECDVGFTGTGYIKCDSVHKDDKDNVIYDNNSDINNEENKKTTWKDVWDAWKYILYIIGGIVALGIIYLIYSSWPYIYEFFFINNKKWTYTIMTIMCIGAFALIGITGNIYNEFDKMPLVFMISDAVASVYSLIFFIILYIKCCGFKCRTVHVRGPYGSYDTEMFVNDDNMTCCCQTVHENENENDSCIIL